jgi:hypothetical protein
MFKMFNPLYRQNGEPLQVSKKNSRVIKTVFGMSHGMSKSGDWSSEMS